MFILIAASESTDFPISPCHSPSPPSGASCLPAAVRLSWRTRPGSGPAHQNASSWLVKAGAACLVLEGRNRLLPKCVVAGCLTARLILPVRSLVQVSGALADNQVLAVAEMSCSASRLPCSSPFSKSPSMLPMRFVTCAKHTTGVDRA